MAYPAVWGTASETHFSLAAFRVLNQELCDLRRKEIKKKKKRQINSQKVALKGHCYC